MKKKKKNMSSSKQMTMTMNGIYNSKNMQHRRRSSISSSISNSSCNISKQHKSNDRKRYAGTTRRQIFLSFVALILLSCSTFVYFTIKVFKQQQQQQPSNNDKNGIKLNIPRSSQSSSVIVIVSDADHYYPRIITWKIATHSATAAAATSSSSKKKTTKSRQIRLPTDHDEIRRQQQNFTASSSIISTYFELPIVNKSMMYITDEDNNGDQARTQPPLASSSSSSSILSFFYNKKHNNSSSSTNTNKNDKNKNKNKKNLTTIEDVENWKQDNCVPMAKWMTSSFPNCNSVHEMDMSDSVFRSNNNNSNQQELSFLGQGWFRSAWKYRNTMIESSSSVSASSSSSSSSSLLSRQEMVVLKTLRLEREFLDEYYDLHRRDAVAMERLTFSPFVVNVYGYCGQSAINELAEGIVGGAITDLEHLNRRLRGREEDPQALHLKLQLATSVALGLAHVHNVHVHDESGGRSKSVKSLLYEHTDPNSITHSTTGFGQSVSTMAHYDINPRNIAIMRDGSPKLNDFNIAEFLTYNPQATSTTKTATTTNNNNNTNDDNNLTTCGFRSRLHEPWWRAPEEMDMTHTAMVTEKVDVYAFGEVLFHILTTHSPRGKMKKHLMEDARSLVRDGIRPIMREPYLSGGTNGHLKQNRVVKAFMKAMDLCYERDPNKRGTAIQVARVLHKALSKEELDRQKKITVTPTTTKR